MNRLQKKCFVASATFHGVLVVALFVGPAFLVSKPKEDNLPVLEVIPAKLVDALISGGGNPNPAPPPSVKTPATPPKAAPVQEARETPPPPVVEPPKVKPTPEKPVEKVKPAPDEKEKPLSDEPSLTPPKKKPKKKPEAKVDEDDDADWEKTDKPAEKPPKHIIQPNLKTVKRINPELAAKAKAEEEAAAEEAARYEAARNARAEAFNRSAGALRSGLSTGTSIEMPGPGGGGEAFANYGQAVKSIYDKAWMVPSDLNDDSASTRVEIVVGKDGRVIRAVILRRAGIGTMDRSVQTTIDRVRSLPPFPEGSTDLQRTFIINFNLKSKLRL